MGAPALALGAGGFTAAITRELRALQARALETVLEAPATGPESLEERIQLVLNRVAEESLSNVSRHSHARRVTVCRISQRKAPLGAIFAAIKDQDGPNDRAAELSRPSVYRLAFGLPPSAFSQLFGEIPARPANGEAVALPGFDLARSTSSCPTPSTPG